MKLLIVTLCFLSLGLAKASDGVCDGYVDLLTRFEQGRVDCEDLFEAIVPGEQGCELREEVATTYAYLVCVLSQDYLGWMTEFGRFEWDKIIDELEEIQVDGELDGIVEQCREGAQAISPDELEQVAAEILSPGVEVGEQEECWETQEAEVQVRRLFAVVCLTQGIGENAPEECAPPPPIL